MKFLRVGEKGEEIVAALDKNKKLRDLSSEINDLSPETLNFKVLQTLKNTNLENFKASCIDLIGNAPECFFLLSLSSSTANAKFPSFKIDAAES